MQLSIDLNIKGLRSNRSSGGIRVNNHTAQRTEHNMQGRCTNRRRTIKTATEKGNSRFASCTVTITRHKPLQDSATVSCRWHLRVVSIEEEEEEEEETHKALI